MKLFSLLMLLLCSHIGVAQKISIRGQVTDSAGAPLPSATVMLLSPKDSTLVNFGATNEQGNFELKNIASAVYLLKITFVGYKTYSLRVQPPEVGTTVGLGVIAMEIARTALDEVVISDKIPVVVKQDTIEFSTSAFKTNRNATVEELLKKLPGVEVDQDGNVTAQGEQVRRVTVDGKDFFGGRDPKLATRNLPADAVNKVQVLDRKSDQAIFSGVDDGQREKAINLELKEEKRRGAFGTVTAGYGSDDRYNVKANINRFNKGNQLSFLGMSNNTNDQGFAMEEYMNFTGGARQMMSGGQVRIQIDGDNQSGVPLDFGNRANGLMQTHAGGLNFNNTFNKKTEVNGSYFFNYLDHQKIQTTLRENFLQQGSFLYDETSQQTNTNENHRVNARVDHKIDSANTIRFSTNMTFTETTMESKTVSSNLSAEHVVLNENLSESFVEGEATAMNSSLLFRHKFPKKGRNLSTSLQFGISQSDRHGLLEASYSYPGETATELSQMSEQDTETLSYGGTLSYTEPLGNRKYIEASYSFQQNRNSVDRPVFDLDEGQAIFNDSLSNRYTSDYIYHRTGLNFRVNRKKFTLTAGASVQQTQLTGDLEILEVQIDRSFQNFLPAARFSYDFSANRHLRFDYETSVQEPTIQQLQPVVDNRDPLNPYQGNPSLRPAYQQSWRLNFNTFDPGSFIGFFSVVDVDYTTNAISNSVTNENFIRMTMPVNVSNNLSVYANATVSFPLTKLKSRFNISGNLRDQQGSSILDEAEYLIRQRTAGGSLRYNYRYKEIFDVTLAAQLNRQKVDYEFDQPDQTFFNKTYTAESHLTVRKNYQFSAILEYLVYENEGTNFNQHIPLINLSVSRFILKNNSGEIKFAVTNLLDEALGINQTSSINYVERVTTNSLGRYFMVSFTYALNKQLNPIGMRRGGGMMRVIR